MQFQVAFGLAVTAGLLGSAAFAAEPLRVVTTTAVLADMAQRTGGDHVVVQSLIAPGSDPHVYEPTAQDAAALAAADVIVVNGLGYEGFIDRLIAASGTTAPVIDSSKGAYVMYLDAEDHHHHEGEEHDHEEEEGAKIPDPHLFQSMKGGFVQMHNILYGFCEVSEELCPFFEERIHAEMETLGYIERELQHVAAMLPQGKRTYLVPHNAFNYFANFYQVKFVSPSAGVGEPSAADLARLITELKDAGVAAAFPIAGADSRLLERLAAELHIPVGKPLYAEGLSGPDGPAADWPQMMRHNMYAIRSAVTE